MDRFICIGEVVKAVGLKGEIKLYPLLDFYEPLLNSGFLIWRDGKKAEIRYHRPASGCTVLQVEKVNDRSRADAMVGRELGFISSDYLNSEFPKPKGGLAFRYLGREVCTKAGQALGVVDEVRLAGNNLMLVIPDQGKEMLIPAVEPILQQDSGLTGTLVIDPPEGLLDVHLS